MPLEPVVTARKVVQSGLPDECPVHVAADGTWRVQDHANAKALLRSADTRQAGFNADQLHARPTRMRMPVLYRDGSEHREHRRQIARFFTPRRVDEKYRALMERRADEQCAVLRAAGSAQLPHLSFALSVGVVAEIIGLTEASRRMARRLELFFADLDVQAGWRSPRAIRRLLKTNYNLAGFFLRDVRPSVLDRRRQRRDDLISHLLDEGCTNGEILGECVTFAAAGMITTREFITAAAWHLFSDDALRKSYLEAPERERAGILHEILRLEPVISDLYRRTTADVQLHGGDAPVTIPAGARVNISITAANVDRTAVGPESLSVCPGRTLADGVAESGLAFGDGPHKCPGAYIAVQSTDIFLTRLLDLPGIRMVREPTVAYRPEVASYELTGLTVAVD